jgi:hypothetical protein
MTSLVKANVTTTGTNAISASGNVVVTFLSICNYSTGNVTANVFVVPSGSIANSSTVVFANLVIQASDTYQIYAGNEKLILSAGDTITINANANTAITTITSYTSA